MLLELSLVFLVLLVTLVGVAIVPCVAGFSSVCSVAIS